MKNCQKKIKQCGNYHFDYVKNLPNDLLKKVYGEIENNE